MILSVRADVAQLVEHVIGNDEVSGSIPDIGSREAGDVFGIERERGRENNCFPVEERLEKPWVFQRFFPGHRLKLENCRKLRRMLMIATLAQLVEHVFRKDGVPSSNLGGGS